MAGLCVGLVAIAAPTMVGASPHRFSQEAPADIAIVSGDYQETETDTPDPLVVAVTDASGTPVPDVMVTFTVNHPELLHFDGQPTKQVPTDSITGQAAADGLTLAYAGLVTATVEGVSGSAVFHLARDGFVWMPVRVEKVSGDDQTTHPGEVFAEPLVVRFWDAYDQPYTHVGVEATISDSDTTFADGSQSLSGRSNEEHSTDDEGTFTLPGIRAGATPGIATIQIGDIYGDQNGGEDRVFVSRYADFHLTIHTPPTPTPDTTQPHTTQPHTTQPHTTAADSTDQPGSLPATGAATGNAAALGVSLTALGLLSLWSARHLRRPRQAKS